MQTHIEGWSNLPEDDINYGNGRECCEQLLDKMEKRGMLPPTRDVKYTRYLVNEKEECKYSLNTWEEEL